MAQNFEAWGAGGRPQASGGVLAARPEHPHPIKRTSKYKWISHGGAKLYQVGTLPGVMLCNPNGNCASQSLLQGEARMKRPARYEIGSYAQLAAVLARGGRLLHKTCQGSQGPSYTVLPGGLRCSPQVAGEAIARGWLAPVDPGLFGPGTAQSWGLRSFDKEY